MSCHLFIYFSIGFDSAGLMASKWSLAHISRLPSPSGHPRGAGVGGRKKERLANISFQTFLFICSGTHKMGVNS